MSIIPKRSSPAARHAPKAVPPAATRPIALLRPANYELIECIVALQLRQAPLEMLAEYALTPLLAMFGASVGALLLHHSEDGSLRLTASAGLSAAGRQHLEILKPGAAGGWEIPLHGLANRKAYIIERPHEHPFVPELVERDEMRATLNLASIPLYRGQLPVGVFLVIADRQPVTDAEILSHVLVYDVLALALDAGLRARGEPPAPLDETAPTELECEEWTDPGKLARDLEIELQAVAGERETLARRLAEIESRYAEALRTLEARDGEHARTLAAVRAEAARRLGEGERAAAELRVRERAAFEEQLAEARARLEAELAERNATFEASVQKLQVALREREAALAARAEELATVGSDRDRSRQAALKAGEAIRRLNGEVERLTSELEAAEAGRAGEIENARVSAERQLADARATLERALAEAEATGAAALARASTAERRTADLDQELRTVRDEAGRLLAERRQVLEALGDPAAEPTAAVRTLMAQIATLTAQLHELSDERDQLVRRAADAAAASARRQATGEREREQLATAHARALDEIGARQRRQLDEVNALHRRDMDHAETAHRGQLSEVRAEAQRRLEQERADAQQKLEQLRAEAQHRLDAVRIAHSEAVARATTAETGAAALAAELDDLRNEVTRLSEERAHILAAVDDPDAEPAAVIRALRDQVAALEGQLGVHSAERTALERRLAAEAQATEARLADFQTAAEARLADARASAQASLDDARAAAAATLAELRAALAEREATLAERESVLAETGGDRDRTRQAAMEATDVIRRQGAELERARLELDATQAALAEARGSMSSLEGRTIALDQDLARTRAEVARLHEERARVVAAVDDPDAEPATVIRALREQMEGLSGQLVTLTTERAALEQQRTAEQASLHERLAALERERVGAEHARAEAERARAEQSARAVALESDLRRSEELLVAARRQLEDALRRSEFAVSADLATMGSLEVRGVATSGAEAGAALHALSRAAAGLASGPFAPAAHRAPSTGAAAPPPTIEVLAPPPTPVVEAGRHQLLESDPTLREHIAAALTDPFSSPLASAQDGTLFVVNLLTALPGRLAELEAAANSGAQLVAYAADGPGRSRILGAVRCFTAPPGPAAFVAAVETRSRCPRCIVTLCDDVDALIPAKGALSKAGHSVSMACDTKQALDLLSILTPDVFLVDLRTAPAAAVEFLDALQLGSGQTLALLVHGNDGGASLKGVVERLLRPGPLAVDALAQACAAVLAGPPARSAPAKALRAVERPRAALRKAPIARRTITKRR